MPTFELESVFSVPSSTLFDWHERPGAFERLKPPGVKIRVIHKQGGIRDGDRLIFDMWQGPLPIRWEAKHLHYQAGAQFADQQVKGPFKSWLHTHRFESAGEDQSRLRDRIEYELPFAPFGGLIADRIISRILHQAFHHRHRRTRDDMNRHQQYTRFGPQRIAISGGSGFVGQALIPFLTAGGHEVHQLVRSSPGEHQIRWAPDRQELNPDDLEGFDVIINLSGESIAGGRWTAERKKAILDSRVQSTKLLSEAIARLKKPPRVFISASAIGYYGDRGREQITERSAAGEGFLPTVCQAWEDATKAAADAGVRVVIPRIGIVLSPDGGALAQMLTPFQFGAGGPIGSGTQVMSWISREDLIGAIYHAIFSESLSGPFNATAPQPVRNAEFAKMLGKVLNRPAIMPLPSPAVKLLFGEMGKELLLEGAKIYPEALLGSGFEFLHPELETALRAELGR